MTQRKYTTIMSGLVVRWKFKDSSYDSEINASRDGVSISGSWPIMKGNTCANIISVLEDARKVHFRLLDNGPLDEIPSAHMFK